MARWGAQDGKGPCSDGLESGALRSRHAYSRPRHGRRWHRSIAARTDAGADRVQSPTLRASDCLLRFGQFAIQFAFQLIVLFAARGSRKKKGDRPADKDDSQQNPYPERVSLAHRDPASENPNWQIQKNEGRQGRQGSAGCLNPHDHDRQHQAYNGGSPISSAADRIDREGCLERIGLVHCGIVAEVQFDGVSGGKSGPIIHRAEWNRTTRHARRSGRTKWRTANPRATTGLVRPQKRVWTRFHSWLSILAEGGREGPELYGTIPESTLGWLITTQSPLDSCGLLAGRTRTSFKPSRSGDRPNLCPQVVFDGRRVAQHRRSISKSHAVEQEPLVARIVADPPATVALAPLHRGQAGIADFADLFAQRLLRVQHL